MTGKELLLAALRGEQTPRPAWLPFVGVHGGAMIGKTASEYLKSADLIVEGLTKAVKLYKPDGLAIAFDLQMEAEVLGCDLEWSNDGPPAVVSHPLSMQGGKTLEQLEAFDVTKGRFPIAYEATRRMKENFGNDLALYGLICGPYTLALHLLGNDIFLKMFDDEHGVKDVIAFCARVAKKAAKGYLDAGCDVIAVVDPMCSQISPEHFENFAAPYLNELFDDIKGHGGYCSLFVCGDATRNLEKMCQTNCDNLSIDENISLEYLVELAGKYKKSIGGNMKLTVVLLMGTPDDAKLDAIRCIDACGTKGFILAPGCDLPYAVPPVNLQAVSRMVHDEYQRDVARSTIKPAESGDRFDDIEIPDYAAEPKVVIDCVTLDSLTCAPCQYMVGAANKAAERFGAEKVEVREHKITRRDGLGYMTKLSVTNIPSICIDGEVKFASIIPDINTLVEAIAEKASKLP